GSIRCVAGPGGARVEVRTRKPVGPPEDQRSPWLPREGIEGNYARLDVSGTPGGSRESPGWRYIYVLALVSGEPLVQLTHYLDLSPGGEERRFAVAVLEQGGVAFSWVGENLELW